MKEPVKILFVEDVAYDFELICRQIKKADFPFIHILVETEPDYKEAISSFGPDLVISDFSLPTFDGRKALEIRNKIIPNVPFILVTGSINEEVAVECMKAGADDYVLKQNLSRLGTAIKSAISKRELLNQKEVAEKSALQERKMLRTLIDNLPDLIYILDAKCRKVIANKADVKNIGCASEEETLGKTDLELYPGTVGERGFADNEQVINSGIPVINMEESFTDKKGKIRWLLTSKFPLYDQNGKVSGLVGIGHDITVRKLMEEKVKESETYYRTLVDLSPDGIFISNLEGTISYCSRKIYDIFSIPPEMNVLGTSVLGWVSPDYHEIVLNRVSKIQAGELRPEIKEYKLLKYDKSPFWAELSSSPINNSTGNPEGLLVICRDITERKRVETELVRSKEKAEESDRLKTAFLHNISHEIRTPMNAIVGFTALLSEPGVDITTMNSYIDVIMNSSNHLLAIINDIIDISNIEANTVKVVKKDVDINGMIRGLYHQFVVRTDEKKIDLSFDIQLSDKDAIVFNDGTKLQQIITNFISNAIKFTAKGGIKFGYSVKDNLIRFFVTDTGIGIPREHQGRIFDRFYQVENPVSKLYEGTGLGLAISKAYAELMGGSIELLSEPGKGSTFFFTIPFDRDENVMKEEAPVEKTPDFVFSIRKRILIAEDIESNFKLLTYFLAGTNSELIRAVNGKEAVEKSLSEKKLDLILMDIKMPVMDGFTATRIIRESNKTIPIIAQTAYSEDREKALEYGCSGFIAKPFDRARLITVLKEALL
jgi:PAS domain S-box-containing protein